jgi:phage host-nuclease inhibitor protein Gam
MSYDVKCLDLAKVFLSDRKVADKDRELFADRLAQEIQDTIEAWTEEYAPEEVEMPYSGSIERKV